MPNIRAPRRGSLQFWPRKRSKRAYARIRTWNGKETKVLGFAGYKVGMSHVGIDNKFNAVTIIECPPLKVSGIRYYKKDPKLRVVSDVYPENLGKGREPVDFDDIKLLANTQPKLTGIGKKKPEVFELGIGGKKEDKLSLAKNLLGKDIRIADIFKKGHYVDIHSVTKGKGFQGTVKRFGVAIRQHKSEKTKRGIGALGSWTPKRVEFTVPQPGKMGYHLRTEFNKLIVDINKEEINPKSGFQNYGVVENDYLIVKGSIAGSRKRLIMITEPIRNRSKPADVNLDYIAIER